MIIRNLEAVFSFRYNPEKLKKATASLDDFAHKANLAIGAIAGSAAMIGLKNFMDNTAAAMDQIGKTSSKLGVSVEALQSFRFAAEQSGVAANTFEMALQRFIRRSAEAAKGTGEAKDALKELGVAVTDSSDQLRDPIIMFNEVADAMAALPNQGDKVRLAMRLFDTEGVALVNLLQGGSGAMKSLQKEAHDLGFVLGKESTDAAANYGDAINRLDKATKGLSDILAVKLIPAYTAMANFSARLVAGLNSVESRASTLRTAMLALGGVVTVIAAKILIAFSPIILTITAIGAGICLAALIIDDLWTAFEGGESILGSLHKKVREFFEPIEQWLLKLPGAVWQSINDSFVKGVDFITAKVNQLHQWALDIIASIQNAISNFSPDFLKKGISATMEFLGLSSSGDSKAPSQANLAPQNISSQNLVQNHSNQSVSVSVNVKSGASAHEIGGEVSKAVRRELEKERMNAFMGVSYAS